MSSNTQVRVRATNTKYLSIERCLGAGSGAILCDVLDKLTADQYGADLRQRLPWEAVAGRERTYRRAVGTHEAVLDLTGSVPRLTVSGTQTTREVAPEVLRAAHAAVNQVLALAVSERIRAKLEAYASERAGERISADVALKALQLQNRRLAIRASCKIVASA